MDVYKFDIKKNILDNFNNKTIILLGEFEVFHVGHLKLLEKAREIQNEEKIGILIINKNDKDEFQTINNRLEVLANIGFDFVICADFNYEFKSTDGKDFIHYLDNNFNVSYYISGQDFRFGNNRKYFANDIEKISDANVFIIDLLENNNIKISSSNIKQMHEFGEYNIIKNLVVLPLIFDIKIYDKKIKWLQNVVMPHYGNYFFKILIDDYWYHGIINFSISKQINFHLINYKNEKEIFDQDSKIKIIDIERIITNSRFDTINDDDINKAINYFSI